MQEVPSHANKARERCGNYICSVAAACLGPSPGHSTASVFGQLAEGSNLEGANKSLVILLVHIARQ